MTASRGWVEAVSISPEHLVSKISATEITLIAGHGVAGDAHSGATVRHRSRVARDPSQPNLRQVHLLHAELLDELVAAGFAVGAGVVGENITTRGLAVLDLPAGALLRFPSGAALEVTGLRNPCRQLDGIQQGLMEAVLDRDAEGNLVRKAGIMAVVTGSGVVRPGDTITVVQPRGQRKPLGPV